jgi:hypothetical protein
LPCRFLHHGLTEPGVTLDAEYRIFFGELGKPFLRAAGTVSAWIGSAGFLPLCQDRPAFAFGQRFLTD